MAKEWILNSAANRYKLNQKCNVGAMVESIRRCSPQSQEEWQTYYFENVRPKDHIIDLGKKLYVKITEILTAEIDDITEEDCIDFMMQLVINRTYDGYVREIKTIYGQLREALQVKIEPAPDDWDRVYNVDFFIKVNDNYIGLQIKPVSGVSNIPEIFKEKEIQHKSHIEFTQKYGGKVFYIFSCKRGDSKIIVNAGVIDEIKAEIDRLK